jgi:hypothetical protein
MKVIIADCWHAIFWLVGCCSPLVDTLGSCYGFPVRAADQRRLSPESKTSSALSLDPRIAVSDEISEAKGPPPEGVSPLSVA